MAGLRDWWRGSSTPSRRFSLVLLLMLLVGGVSVTLATGWLMQQAVVGRTWVETVRAVDSHFVSVFKSDIFVTEAHDHHDAYAPPSRGATVDPAQFDRTVRGHLQIYDVVHARFYRADGQIVYSYTPAEVGRSIATLAPNGEAGRALHGETVVREGDPATLGVVTPMTLLSFHIPVMREGRVVGAAWIQRDVSVLAATTRQAQAVLVALVGTIFALLFFALRRVYADSTSTIRAQSTALAGAYDATLRALVAALDSRDTETGGHAQRVTRLAMRLGAEVGLGPDDLIELERGALLHDIGKIGVPDAILRKPGPLTDEEWVLMRRHAALGASMLDEVPFLGSAAPLVRHHHERWDGRGYPDGLAGEAIPLGARIFAVADAFDAMTSRRPYRQPFTLRQARAEIGRCAGAQFDPEIVAAVERLTDDELLALMEVPVLGEPVAVAA